MQDALLAQLVEHLTLNQGVQGSSPWRRTKEASVPQKTELMLFFQKGLINDEVWLSLVERHVRDVEAASSNLVTSTVKRTSGGCLFYLVYPIGCIPQA